MAESASRFLYPLRGRAWGWNGPGPKLCPVEFNFEAHF